MGLLQSIILLVFLASICQAQDDSQSLDWASRISFDKFRSDKTNKLLETLPKHLEENFRKTFPEIFSSVSPSVTPSTSPTPSTTPSTSPNPSSSPTPSVTPTKSNTPVPTSSPTPSKSPSPTPFRGKYAQPSPSSSPNIQEVTVQSEIYDVPTDNSEVELDVEIPSPTVDDGDNQGGEVEYAEPEVGDTAVLSDFIVQGDFGGDIAPTGRQLFGEKVLNRPAVRQSLGATFIRFSCNGKIIVLRVSIKCNGGFQPLTTPQKITTELVQRTGRRGDTWAGLNIVFSMVGPYGNACRALFRFDVTTFRRFRRRPSQLPSLTPFYAPSRSSTVTPSIASPTPSTTATLGIVPESPSSSSTASISAIPESPTPSESALSSMSYMPESPTPSASASVSEHSISNSPTPSASLSASESVIPESPRPSASASSSTSIVPESPTPTSSASASESYVPESPTPSGTASASTIPSLTPSATVTASDSAQVSFSPSGTASASASATASATASNSAIPTSTPSPTMTASESAQASASPSATASASVSATSTTTPTPTISPTAFAGIRTSDVSATVYSESNAVDTSLFGAAKTFSADLAPGVHPRIAFSNSEWETIVNNFAANRAQAETWSKYFLDYTVGKGPNNAKLVEWASLDTSAYTGTSNMDSNSLKILADKALDMGEYNEGGLFMFALHVAVNDKIKSDTGSSYLSSEKNTAMTVQVAVNWAKIILAHYFTYGCDSCAYVQGDRYSQLWDSSRRWEVKNDWYTGGLGLALSYDVLYSAMTVAERRTVRSALGIMVKDRYVWGTSDDSTDKSPNAVLHPHRIFSNWAIYQSNLYLTNLAIEGESDFDEATSAVGIGFSTVLNSRFEALAAAYIAHSLYPSGSTFEDGYQYNIGFREGSLAVVALARRGQNYIDTPRFRNFIMHAAQMTEPWSCGEYVGHSGGGGYLYPPFYGLARYTYPNGILPGMVWRQRMTTTFTSTPCRISWHQTMMQLAILGGEHGVNSVESPQNIPSSHSSLFPHSVYYMRRGLLVARSSLQENALYIQFDTRPDALFAGHDNADRGVVTMSALRRMWLDDMPWREHPTSQDHSIVHVDNQAQAEKAPPPCTLKVLDDGNIVLAASDLRTSYNVQWARAWQTANAPRLDEIVYINGVAETQSIQYTETETSNPRSFCWPADDSATDLGFTDSTSLWGEPNIGFAGLWTWTRAFRQVSLERAVRSVVLVRDQATYPYFLLGDNFDMSGTGTHVFDSYFILAAGVSVSTGTCTGSSCHLTLDGGDGKFMELYFNGLGNSLSYSTEPVDGRTRFILRSPGRNNEQFCTVFLPRQSTIPTFSLERSGNGCIVDINGVKKTFTFNSGDGTLEVTTENLD